MKSNFNHSCQPEKVYEKYYIDIIDGKSVIKADEASGYTEKSPFDDALALVLKYLEIGYNEELGLPTEDMVFDFISEYGYPKRKDKYADVADFAEDAQALYLHFAEISAEEYPNNPDWILETENEKAIIRRSENGAYIEWQTKNLSGAIELAYTLIICGNERALGICKHCGSPFAVVNPKTEFCSPPCRNRYNVYKSRSKNK